jgi:hypothetical protein
MKSLTGNTTLRELESAFPDFKFDDGMTVGYFCMVVAEGQNPNDLKNTFKNLWEQIELLNEMHNKADDWYDEEEDIVK